MNSAAYCHYFVNTTAAEIGCLYLEPVLLNLLLIELVIILHLQIPKIILFRKPKLAKFRKLHASEKYPFYSISFDLFSDYAWMISTEKCSFFVLLLDTMVKCQLSVNSQF